VSTSARTALGVAGGIAGGAAVFAGITLLARAAGFGRWLVFSGSVSAECVGNAYSTANQLPNVLFEVVAGGALAGAVVPLLAGPLARSLEASAPEGERARHRGEVDRTASALLTWALVVLAPLALLLALLAGPLVRLAGVGDGCDGAAALASRMLVVFSPQVVLYGAGVVLAGVLTAHRRLVWPALGPLLSSLVVMVAYVMFARTAQGATDDPSALPAAAEAWLAWGTTAGVAAMTLPMLWPVRAAGVRLRPTLRFPPGVARRAAALAGAGLVTLVAQQASVVAVLLLSNGPGSTATLNVFQYTQAVYLLPYALLAVPLATAAFPQLAERAATGDTAGFAATAAWTTRAVVLVSAAGAAVLVAVAVPVAAFFGHLDSGRVAEMAPALVAMAPGLVGFALVAHVGRALYALERGRAAATATVAGWVAVVVAMVGLALLVQRPADVAVALGAGSSVGMTVAGAALLVALRRAAGAAALAGLVRTLLGAGASAVLAGAAGWWVSTRLDGWSDGAGGAVLAGVVAALVALGVLALALPLLDRPTVRAVTRLAGRRRGAATAGPTTEEGEDRS
jgi:putative peptidoglycan lipid II flippase